MFFWILASGLTALTLFVILRPLLRNQVDGILVSSEFDREVYKDQLAEIDADLATGLIGPDDAQSARTEISRRLLATAQFSDQQDNQSKFSAPISSAFPPVRLIPISLLFILITGSIYIYIGNPLIPDQPLVARQAEIESQIASQVANQQSAPVPDDIKEMVARAEAHLVQNPDDGRGWNVLAPIYFRMGDFIQAQIAFANAIKYEGSTAFRHSGLGETIVSLNEGIVTYEARTHFERALEFDRNDPRASFFLALGLAQDEKDDEAITAFEEFAKRSPADAPWIGAIRNQIAIIKSVDPSTIELETAQTSANASTPNEQALPGPTKEQIDAASEMDATDRMEMIRSMVASLDEKLKDDPQNITGWQRLIQSYIVLGDTQKAADATKRALATFPPNSNEGKMLIDFAAESGIDLTQEPMKQDLK